MQFFHHLPQVFSFFSSFTVYFPMSEITSTQSTCLILPFIRMNSKVRSRSAKVLPGGIADSSCCWAYHVTGRLLSDFLWLSSSYTIDVNIKTWIREIHSFFNLPHEQSRLTTLLPVQGHYDTSSRTNNRSEFSILVDILNIQNRKTKF